MAKAGTVEIVFSADTRPAIRAIKDVRDRLRIHTAVTPAEKRAVYAVMYRRALFTAAEGLRASARHRRPRDPRRLADRFLASACASRARSFR